MILVTGATGHLGANLVRRLLADGEKVRVLVRDPGDAAVAGLDIELAQGDLRDPAACRAAVHGCQSIHHCAAQVSTLSGSPRLKKEIFETNVLGTRNLLRAAREHHVERVVVTSSLSAVGYDPARPSDESMPFDPFAWNLPYGVSKACEEHECLKACADGLPVVLAVSCAILGPNDFKPSRMGRTLIDFAHRKLRAYAPGGFEFVSAADMVQGHLLCMKQGRPGQRYIFSTQYLSVDELLGIFEEVTGQPRPKLRLPPRLMATIASVMDGVLRFFPDRPRRFTPAAVRLLRMQRRVDCTKAKTELGYQPGNIVEAIRQAYGNFLERGLINLAQTPAAAPTITPAAEGRK